MSGGLRPGLLCPECGRSVVMVYHEWRGPTNTAMFEYHHHDDVERGARGEPTAMCVVVLPYDEGLTRYRLESDE